MPLEEERRLVTVLFADLVGFTGRAEASDPELVREIQRAYFAAVSAEVERYGGSVEKYIGDAVMAIFGVPKAHDDDAERALKTALRIREAVGRLDYELELRIGVNTGEVVGGAGSGAGASEYTVTGDAVNLAARLQQAAGPSEILLGAATRRLVGEAFELDPLPPLMLKGKTTSVEAWRLVAERPLQLRLRREQAPLVGRARELSSLEAGLLDAESGRGLLLAIVGEAGIGKSRLALEVRQRAESRGFQTISAAARSYSEAFPYHVLSQLIDELVPRDEDESLAEALTRLGLQADPPTIDRWAALLAETVGKPVDAPELKDLTISARHHGLVQAVLAMLEAHTRLSPILVVLDDLHWFDAASLSILDEVVEALPHLPILVVALYRPGWSHGWAEKSFYQQLNLGGLRSEETRRLAEHLLGARDPSAPPEAVLVRSGGNPFFLEELLRAVPDPSADEHRLPETVHEIVLARIDALPTRPRHVLQLASVAGLEFSQPMLEAVEPEDGIDEALSVLQRQDLVVLRGRDPEATFAFRHPLIHEVAYRSLLVARRREVHRRIADWLERRGGGEELLPILAAHYRDGDDRAKARLYLPGAADRAARLSAVHEALRWYLEAADLFPDLPGQRATMLERAATQSYLAGDVEQAIKLVQEAAQLYQAAGDLLHALDCRRWLGRYYWFSGRGTEAEAEIIEAIKGLERLPASAELALAYSYLAQVRMLMPDYKSGVHWARKAIEIAEPMEAIAALVHAYNNLGVSLLGLGDPSGISYLRQSLDLAVEHHLADDAGRAYVNLSGQGFQVNLLPYREAEAFLAEAVAYAERTIPGGSYDQWIRSGQCEFWVQTGRWEDADRQLAAISRLIHANRYVRVNVAAYRALIAAYRGEYEAAAELIRPDVEAAVRIGDLQAFTPVFIALAHVELGLGDAAGATEALARWIEMSEGRPDANITAWFVFEATDVATSMSLAAAPLGDVISMLSRSAERALPYILRGGTPAELAVRRALFGAGIHQLVRHGGRVHVPTGAGASALPTPTEAIAALDDAHRVFDSARIRLWLAEAGVEGLDLTPARAVFEALRAAPYVARSYTPVPGPQGN